MSANSLNPEENCYDVTKSIFSKMAACNTLRRMKNVSSFLSLMQANLHELYGMSVERRM